MTVTGDGRAAEHVLLDHAVAGDRAPDGTLRSLNI
jgi:hypothetical protein